VSRELVLPALTVAGLGLLLLVRPLAVRAGRLTGIPHQFYRIAINPRLRRNHALEHATLNVLTQRHGLPQVNGAAVQGGFVIRGWVNPAEIASAAREGLARLQAGERALAYHRRCGTSLATGDLLISAALMLALFYAGRFTFGAVLTMIGIVWIVSPLAGWLVQRWLTTSADVTGLTIKGMTFTPLPAGTRVRRGVTNPPGTVPGQVIVLVERDVEGAPDGGKSSRGGLRRLPGWPN
jgi:hypothetical protein